MQHVCVMDSAGRFLIGDVVEMNNNKFVLDNVFVLEHVLVPSGVGSVGIISVPRPVVNGVGLLHGVHVIANLWFEVPEGTSLWRFVEEERQKIRASSLGIVTPDNIVIEK